MIKTRFAPSPTGYLHIGGARTALFNWMYTQSQGGSFVLRIEDSDQVRSKKKFLDEILGSMKWLGLDWDELYYQSKRFDIYRQYAEKLLKEDKAYREGEAVILKIPEGEVKVYDIIRGEITFDTQTIKDQVLIKSDGSPTYSFACVIDDALMEISHVIRGEDHISNTPKQIMIYDALGFKLPKFVHMPLIMGDDGERLSKRTGAIAVSDYRKMGFLPEAIVNYLMLLGWSPGNNQEIMKISSATSKFSIKKINKNPAVFSIDKLKWVNAQYIRQMDVAKLTDLLIPFLKEKKYICDDFDRKRLESIVKLYKPKLRTLLNFLEWADFAFIDNPKIDDDAKLKHLSKDKSKEFNLLAKKLEGLRVFDTASTERAFRDLAAELNISTSDLVHPVRVALTGKAIGPGLFDSMAVLGKDKTIKRLKEAFK